MERMCFFKGIKFLSRQDPIVLAKHPKKADGQASNQIVSESWCKGSQWWDGLLSTTAPPLTLQVDRNAKVPVTGSWPCAICPHFLEDWLPAREREREAVSGVQLYREGFGSEGGTGLLSSQLLLCRKSNTKESITVTACRHGNCCSKNLRPNAHNICRALFV